MTHARSIFQYTSLVFDVDGTLIDSVDDIVNAMSMTLVGLGHDPLPAGYAMPNLHSTSDIIIADVFRDLGHPAPMDLAAVRAAFYRNYIAFDHATAQLYPGVREFLQECAEQGLRLGICTNKKENIARDVLARLEIADYFQAITGCDTYEEAKPSALPLLKTLERMNTGHENALFFGDTHVDAECAQRSRVGFVLHTPGYGGTQTTHFPQVIHFDDYAALRLAGMAQPSA